MRPRFVRRFAELHETVGEATKSYVSDVKGGLFPTEANSFSDQPPVRLAEVAGTGAGYGPK